MDTRKGNFMKLEQSMKGQRAGISISLMVKAYRVEQNEISEYMVYRGRATSDKAGIMHDLMTEMLFDSKLDDQKIFKQLVLETRSGMESRVQGA